jgi:hypothetical protein
MMVAPAICAEDFTPMEVTTYGAIGGGALTTGPWFLP